MVTAVTPTPAEKGSGHYHRIDTGSGCIDKKVIGALREPSVGPTFGVKGGATGGGHSQVYPMWDIDLHFTGDIHAVGSAHKSVVRHLENELVGTTLWHRPVRLVLKKTMDMNCRELRNIVVGLGDSRVTGGVTHQGGF